MVASSTERQCGSTELYSKVVDANGAYGPTLLPLGLFATAKLRVRVCGNCGLLEWSVPSELLPKVKAKFEKEP